MSVLQQLLAELGERGDGAASFKAVANTGAPVGPYVHGPNGLWSYPGLERPVISTRIQPRGIAGMLPARATNVMNPLYPYLTGVTYPSVTQPNGVCDNPPLHGAPKNCFQTATFGRYSQGTQPLDITRLGQIINRSEFTDLFYVNPPLGASTGRNGITVPSSAQGNLSLNSDVQSRFTMLGIQFQNQLMRQVWDGNPVNNTAGGGYQEFPGLDILIGTGKKDAVTGQACPSLDSMITNYNYANVNTTTGNSSIVNVLTYQYRMLRDLASRTGLDPVEWVFVMRETLFYEISAQWPCSYMTYRCILGGNTQATVNVDGGDMVAMRDAMRNGRYLVLDGIRVNVVFDDAIDEQTSGDSNRITNGSFASDIVILPLTVRGGQAVTFWEYFAWDGPNAALSDATISASPLMSSYYWTDGGQYLWHMKPPENWCVQWIALIKPRLILLTPHLCARINNVQYSTLMHTRDAFADDPYYVNGGVTERVTAPSLYPSWTV